MEKKGFYKGVIFTLAFLGFSRSFGWALNKGFTFPLLSEYSGSAFVRGIILGLQGLIGMIIPILLGYMSDTVKSKHGRRKPFILAGGALSGIAAFMIYTSFRLGAPLWLFTLVIAIFYLLMYSYTSQFRALLPELISSGDRGRASGFITVAEWGGNLALFALSGYFVATYGEWGKYSMFIITMLFLVAASIFTYFRVKEPKRPDKIPEQGLISYLKSILKNKNFLHFYTAQVLLWMSFEFIAIFVFGIVAFILHGDASTAHVNQVHSFGLYAMAGFNVTVLVGSLSGGYIYDKIGRRLGIITGAVILALPLLGGWFVQTKMQILAALLIAGVGWGALLAASLPVVGDLLTKYKKEVFNGRYYGVFEATKALPILLSAVVGGVVVDMAGGNYRLLFPLAAILVIIAIPLIWSLEELEEE